MFGRIFGRLNQLFEVHRTRATLCELSDEQLRDIGITRLEAEREVERRPWDSTCFGTGLHSVGNSRMRITHTSFSRH